ncbi:MAG: DUF4252 domain-containing protein [Bacteroidota bacterium]
MKKFLLLLVAALMGTLSYAQQNFISDQFSQHENDPSFTKVNITDKTFELFNDIATQDADEQRVVRAIANLTGIKALFKEKSEDTKALYLEALDKLQADQDYEELASVQTSDEGFLLVLREANDQIEEVTLLVGSEEKFLLATLFGDIDLKSISRISQTIRKDGRQWFDLFDNIDSDELVFGGATPSGNNPGSSRASKAAEGNFDIRVFPNPVGDYVQLDDGKNSDATYELEFFSPIGESVKRVGQVNLPYRIQLEDLPSGAYFVRLTDAEGAFRNYRIIKP